MSFKRRTAPAPAAGFEAMLSGFSDSPALADLAKSMRASVAEYRATTEQLDRIGADKTLTDGAKLVRQASVARAKMDTALAKLATAKAGIEAGRKNVEAKLAEHTSF